MKDERQIRIMKVRFLCRTLIEEGNQSFILYLLASAASGLLSFPKLPRSYAFVCAEELPECRLVAEAQFVTNLRDGLVFVLQALAGMQHQFVGKSCHLGWLRDQGSCG